MGEVYGAESYKNGIKTVMGEFPNKDTQFTSERQPAHNGRPKGSKNLKTMLVELLSSQDPDGEWAKSIAGQLIRKAFRDSDMRAMQEIIERIEGKVPGQAIIDQSKHDHITVVIGKLDNEKLRSARSSMASI